MKSKVAQQMDLDELLFSEDQDNALGKLLAQYELFRKVSQVEGSIVKCGIATEESFTKFVGFQKVIGRNLSHRIVAFEKNTTDFSLNGSATTSTKLKPSAIDFARISECLVKKHLNEKIDLISGNYEDTIPDYLMNHPDLKISFLNINLNDYRSALTSLQYFYPRLVHNGILTLINYHKRNEEYKAVTEYFKYTPVKINNFSLNKGPHYIVRE